jgi:hypothetical protein
VLPFDLLFHDIARRECLAIEVADSRSRPAGLVIFREFYCNDPGCDCRRVVLHAAVAGQQRIIAGIGYGFEPPKPPFDDEPQAMLDPLNPQSELSEVVLDLFTKLVESEPSVRARFIEHYAMWKRVVDDPTHPDHGKVRSKNHDDSTFSPAYRPGGPTPFPANQRCYCRSGKKFKNCCAKNAAVTEHEAQ